MAEVITPRDNPLRAANPHPRSNTCYGIAATGDGAAFCAAESGTIFEWREGEIITHRLDNRFDFYDAFAFSSSDVFAVGTHGAVWHWDGASWSEMTVIVPEELGEPVWIEAVWGRAPDDLYVAGDEATVFHFDGQAWRELIKTPEGRRRPRTHLYSIDGLDDGTVYVTGSWGNIVKIQGDRVEWIRTGFEETLNGIMRVPGTDRFLVCGTGGTLFWFENDQVTPIEAGTDDSFYGIDAQSADHILAVGWKGNTLFFDGERWTPHFTGRNSFLEGVAHVGGGVYFACGWYGRLMRFDPEQRQWSTHQNGRAETTLAVSLSDTDRVLATTDIGNLLHGDINDRELTLSFAPPVDLHVAVPLGGEHHLIAGERGFVARVDLTRGAPKIEQLPFDGEDNFVWGQAVGASTLLVTETGRLFRLDRETLVEERWFHEALGGESCDLTVQSVAVEEAGALCVLGEEDGEMRCHLLRTGDGAALRLNLPEGGHLLAGNGGDTLLATGSAIYHLSFGDQWQRVLDVGGHMRAAGERITALATVGEELLVGGSRGTVIVVKAGEPLMVAETWSTGAFRPVNSLTASRSLIAAGLTSGRVVLIDRRTGKKKSSAISAPTYHSVSGMDGGFLIAGDAGALGVLRDGENQVEIQDAGTEGDLLVTQAFEEFGDDTVCAGGVECLLLIVGGQVLRRYHLKGITITTMAAENGTILMGTAEGTVIRLELETIQSETLEPNDLQTVMSGLGGTVMALKSQEGTLTAITEDGGVHRRSAEVTMKLGCTLPVELRRPSSQLADERIMVAGGESLLLLLGVGDWPMRIELPEHIWTVTLFGAAGPGDFWIGGSSGTLYHAAKAKWIKVHTGIGNHLHSVAVRGGRVVVTGRYGAVRFDEVEFIERSIA